MEPAALLATTVGKQSWFWGTAVAIVGLLVLANLLLFLIVFGRRLRQLVRARRTARFERECEELLDEVESATGPRDLERMRARVRGFNELERPIAATLLVERLRAAPPERREAVLAALRNVGGTDLLERSLHRRMPWRRALAIRTAGLLRDTSVVPELIELLSDNSRYVREAAVRALGRIGDVRALPPLADFFLKPSRAAPGIVYEAMLEFGEAAAPVFHEGLLSDDPVVRITSCYGIAGVLEPSGARAEVEPMVGDPAGEVRAAASEQLGRIPGPTLPGALLDAARDETLGVRRAAVTALGSYDDARSLPLLVAALDDPDRDVALRAGESLVRLGRLPRAGAEARATIDQTQAWPLETARALASLGAV
jgi:HEAT repeat protein